MTYNVRPVQIRPIEWPWENKIIAGMPHLVASPGEIRMPDIMSCFDWTRCEIVPRLGLLPEIDAPVFVASDLKSVFTTALRFLGFQLAMLQIADGTLDIVPIRSAFLQWHARFMRAFGQKIDAVVIGDDWAHNGGMMISPQDWSHYVAPFITAILSGWDTPVYVHSDGDIGRVIDHLAGMRIEGLIYQPVGSMRYVGGEYRGMRLIATDPATDWYPGYPVKETAGPTVRAKS